MHQGQRTILWCWKVSRVLPGDGEEEKMKNNKCSLTIKSEGNKWLEEKIKKLSPDAQAMAREIWECDEFEDLEKLVHNWKKETKQAAVQSKDDK